MKKILILLMLVCTVVTASANAPLVIDNADVLSAIEEQALTEQLEDIQKSFDVDVVVLTEDSLNGKDPMSYADDYFDYNGYGKDGVLLLLDMGGHNWWMSTSGNCIWAIDADAMGECFVPLLSKGAYYEGFALFAKMVQETMEQPDDIESYSVDAFGNIQVHYFVSHWYDGLGLSLLFGLLVGGIAVAVMACRMKSVRAKSNAADYVNRDSLELTRQEDRYLYQTVTRRAKPKNNGGTHRGSSGRSHGGGGGRF